MTAMQAKENGWERLITGKTGLSVVNRLVLRVRKSLTEKTLTRTIGTALLAVAIVIPIYGISRNDLRVWTELMKDGRDIIGVLAILFIAGFTLIQVFKEYPLNEGSENDVN